LLVGVLLYMVANLGGGDAKLIAVLGLLLGPARIAEIVGYGFAIGAAWSILVLLRAGLLQRLALHVRLGVRTALTPGVTSVDVLSPLAVRFGPLLALSTVLVEFVPQARFVALP